MFDIERPDWFSLGNCIGADPDIFFPERGKPTDQAKAFCLHCPVRLLCREFALDRHIENGIWGGLSGRERKQLRRANATRPSTDASRQAG